jgi:hypothetical protein
MVTRNRVQGETIKLAALPRAESVANCFANFKGPSGTPVVTQGVRKLSVVGVPWLVDETGFFTDFGPIPLTRTAWLITQDTSAFVPGQWAAEIWAVDSFGSKSVLTTVSFTITPSIAVGGSNDQRSQAQRAVENIEAYLANPNNFAAASYKINNRELQRYSIAELRDLLGYWKTRLREENIRASGRRGVIGRRIEVFL